jgi:hypothetical protein
MIVLLVSFAVAAVKGWYILNYGLVVTAVVYGFVYVINVTRFEGRPSYEEEEAKEKREQREPEKEGPAAPR